MSMNWTALYQTVGHRVIDAISECMEVPLFRQQIRGSAVDQTLNYVPKTGDEVEDLYELLSRIQREMPEVKAVCSGAILSTYQRLRVENVCERLGLVSLGYLWERDQKTVFDEMIQSGISAVLIKVACMGLDPRIHLGKDLRSMRPHLWALAETYGCNPCGEGGEYETLTLDCPLFKKRIVLEDSYIDGDFEDDCCPVGYLRTPSFRLEEKEDYEPFKVLYQPSLYKAPELVQTPEYLQKSTSFLASIRSSGSASLHQLTSQETEQGFVVLNARLANEDNAELGDGLEAMFSSLALELERHSLSLSSVGFASLFVSDMNDFSRVNAFYRRQFSTEPPSRCCIEPSLPSNVRVSIELIAYRHRRDALHVQSISRWAPACIGPYSQATTIGPLVMMAGQIALEPGSMSMKPILHEYPHGPDAVSQLNMCLEHCRRVLKAKKSRIEHAVSIIVYGLDMALPFITEEFSANLNVNAPVIFVPVRRLPRDALVEVQVLALTDDACYYEKPIHTAISSTQTEGCIDETLLQMECVELEDTVLSVQSSLPCSMVSNENLGLDETIVRLIRDLSWRLIEADLSWDTLVCVRVVLSMNLYEDDIDTAVSNAMRAVTGLDRTISTNVIPVETPILVSTSSKPQAISILALFCKI